MPIQPPSDQTLSLVNNAALLVDSAGNAEDLLINSITHRPTRDLLVTQDNTAKVCIAFDV
jgi:hypothetical protein